MKNKDLLYFSLVLLLSLLSDMAGAVEAPSADIKGLTLYEALAETYQKNPDLEAVRAQLRSVDESYAQAMAGFKPIVEGVADYVSAYSSHDSGHTSSDAKTLSLEVTQSVYSGGSTVADVDRSTNLIKAKRAELKLTEQQILLEVVRAYMGLIRDQEIVEIRFNNERVIGSHLKASHERFKLGDITKTDVSQAESRLAKALASRIAAEGNLKRSRAFFERVVGLTPDQLQKTEVNISLPASETEAIDLALKNNPFIFLTKYTEGAAKALTRVIEGERLPQVGVTGALNKIYDPASISGPDARSQTVSLRAVLPLYTGGATMSRIREAQQLENQRRMEAYSAERAVRQDVVDAWATLRSAEAESRALQSQIDASKLALEGVTIESKYGSRTTLDLLDAEQEYLDSQVAHVSAETDRLIAAFGLLAAVGNLTAQGLKLTVPIYDTTSNFQNLNGKVFNWPYHKDK